ncbi:MAG: 50S ribosomal protein L11 methyltransferase [Bacteroidetes bacterium]|nr:50S ribosomal protein L11 methyltransferase [Bacteroidota bacterium]
MLDELKSRYRQVASLSLEVVKIKRQNWNKQWEENFCPVEIGSKCRIRESFHEPDASYDIEIVIDLKMSFGTVNHETTSLMIEAQLQTDHSGMDVLDCGCGTGILTIFAKMPGSKNVT